MRFRLLAPAFLALATLHSVVSAQVSMLSLAEADAQLAELAAETARRGPVSPVPLSGDGSYTVGAVYDGFLIGVAVGRSLMTDGRTIDGPAIAAHPAWRPRAVVVVAYPVTCDGKPNHPLDVRWKGGILPVAPALLGGLLRGSQAASQLPGVVLPDDALVAAFSNVSLISGTVEIDYAESACHGAAKTMAVAVTTAPSRTITTAFNGIKLPAELSSLSSPSTVRMQVWLDPAGRARFANQVQGPAELGPAAMAALQGRTFEPARVNGVSMPFRTMVPFVFTATGAPGEAEPFTPPQMTSDGRTIVRSGTATVMVPVPSAPTPLPPLPPAPPGQSDTMLARLAIEVAQRGTVVPISLDPAGPVVHGVLFDRFLVGAVKARAAIAAGTPFDPASASPTLVQNDLVAVAYPLACAGRAVAPADVHVFVGGTAGGMLRPTGPLSVLDRDGLAIRLPSVMIPDGAIGRTFVNAAPSQNLEVRVTYAQTACAGDSRIVALPVQWVRGTVINRQATAKLPSDVSLPSPVTVQVRGLVDLDGRYRFPTIADGPPQLAEAVLAAAAQWRFQPYRANGVPMPQLVVVPVTFTDTGLPVPMPIVDGGRSAPPGPISPIPARPDVITSSTINGRSTVDRTSATVPGLDAATSRCAISTDAAYGATPAGAIRIGGGPAQGPARERQYLDALRGPEGQGLHVVRRGATMGPDGATILDLYDVTYVGQGQPLQLYLDEYHAEPLQAPKGLVCASPLDIR